MSEESLSEGQKQEIELLALRFVSNHGPSTKKELSKAINHSEKDTEAVLLKSRFFIPPRDREQGEWNLSDTGREHAKYHGLKEKFQSATKSEYSDMLNMAERFIKKLPLFYDRAGLWWVWNTENNNWMMVDEIDILNWVDELLEIDKSTTKSNTRNEILESLKRTGRKNIPKDIEPTWVQFRNTIVDIRTGEEYPPSPQYFCTNPIPWDLGETEDTPQMDRIFEGWVGKEYVPTLYEIIAYCLLPDYPLARIFCLNGAGLNGKSKFLELIRRFLGAENCCSTDLDTLLSSRFEQARLYKKLMAEMGETNFGAIRRTERIKKLVGGDLIPFEFKNKNPFSAVNYAKIIIASNQLPMSYDKTPGFYRRWLIIDFPNQFSEKKNILNEIPELEYQNLARKSIKILQKLLNSREFTNEGTIAERERKYEEASNPVQLFIEQNCKEDIESHIFFSEFYEKFSAFLRDKGRRRMTAKEVGSILKNSGYISKNIHIDISDGKKTTRRAILGIIWKGEDTEQGEDNNDNDSSTDTQDSMKNENTDITNITDIPEGDNDYNNDNSPPISSMKACHIQDNSILDIPGRIANIHPSLRRGISLPPPPSFAKDYGQISKVDANVNDTVSQL